MELRRGYKLTEVGVIPEGWKVNALPEISWFQEGPGLRNWQFTSAGMKVINVTNLEHGVLNLKRTDRHISIAEFNRMYRHFAIDAADIVMASSGNSYCKTAAVREQDLPLVMNTSVIRFKPSQSCDYGFLWVILTSPLFKGQIDLMITGGAQPNFGPYHLKRVFVPVPPLAEQRAIAAALNDVDALLGGLDRLVAKKRDLKQAAMQQLLTGQTRLPGFSGEWEVKRLEDVLDTDPENLGSNTRSDFTFNYIALEDVDQGIVRSHSEQVFASAPLRARRRLRANDVLVSTVRPNLQSHLYFRAESGNWVCSTGFCVARCREGVTSPGYVFYHLFADCVNRQIEALLTGSNYPAINSGDVRASEIPFPKYDEQTAIAAVLSDMDAELSALEARRDKTRALKQAMMQELLTGRVRLISGELKVESA
jgi:type I restriction enzyme S subunit